MNNVSENDSLPPPTADEQCVRGIVQALRERQATAKHAPQRPDETAGARASDEEDLTSGRGGVHKRRLRAPEGDGGRPPPGSMVTVHYEGWLINGSKFDSSRDRDEPFTFKLGVGEVIEGWDLAVASMAPGEVASYTVRSDYAYGWEGKPPKIPVDATLRFEVELIAWTPAAQPLGEMSAEQLRAHGLERREEGTRLLRGGQHAEAAAAFESAVEALHALHAMMARGSPEAGPLREVADALRSSLLNLSQAELKLSRWEAAARSTSRVLQLAGEGANAKALFRRGKAHLALERHAAAKEDLRAACLADPKSREARQLYEEAKAQHSASLQKERAAFGGMFAAAAAAPGARVVGASVEVS